MSGVWCALKRMDWAYNMTIICGLVCHAVRINYYQWKYPALDEPNLISWVFLFSILNIIASMQSGIMRIGVNCVHPGIYYSMHVILTTALAMAMMQLIWLPGVYLIQKVCIKLTDHLQRHGVANMKALTKWLQHYSYFCARWITALIVIAFMLEVIGFYSYVRKQYKRLTRNGRDCGCPRSHSVGTACSGPRKRC